jgi:SAM-dependent methyltransferase
MAADRERLRLTFDEDAERYARRRPGYPEELFDDLARRVPLAPGSRVLEIGCGTGQATLPLARRGYHVTAVELGEAMAAAARHKVAAFDTVHIVRSAFEDWPLPEDGFDLVIAATSFHWVDPDIRMTKAADALRPGGALALITTHHVAGGTEDFFANSQRYYERFDPDTPPGLRAPTADEVPCDASEFDRSGRFGPVDFLRYQRDLPYTTSEYLDLIGTYSNHRALPDAARRGLFDGLAHLIDTDHGGGIVKAYLFELAVARRVS